MTVPKPELGNQRNQGTSEQNAGGIRYASGSVSWYFDHVPVHLANVDSGQCRRIVGPAAGPRLSRPTAGLLGGESEASRGGSAWPASISRVQRGPSPLVRLRVRRAHLQLGLLRRPIPLGDPLAQGLLRRLHPMGLPPRLLVLPRASDRGLGAMPTLAWACWPSSVACPRFACPRLRGHGTLKARIDKA